MISQELMMGPKEVTDGIYMVGGAEITDARDGAVYLLDLGELVLIDAGAGPSADKIAGNIERLGFDLAKLSTLILTHCHIDHVGGARRLRDLFGCKIVMHELDAVALEEGDERMTAAIWYHLPFSPLAADVKLKGEEERLLIGDQELVLMHTPGHTPGSISVYIDRGGKRVLFGQDIHGPFSAEFGSDLGAWRRSMERLLSLGADILCEGHFGLFSPRERVQAYIEHYLWQYKEEV